MRETGRTRAVVDRLKEYRERHGGSEWNELDAESLSLVRSNPFAFLIAVAFDRGMRWPAPWQIPKEIDRKGFLDPRRMASMSRAELIDQLASLPRRPRWGTKEGATTLSDAASLVCGRFNGDARSIWTNSPPAEVQCTLREIHGIGPGIASMATRILHDDCGFFRGQERQIDVKPDIHLIRVFRRLGLIGNDSEEEAVGAARRLNPEYPGALDWPAWRVGNRWCHPTKPDCARCPLTRDCPKLISVAESQPGLVAATTWGSLSQPDEGPVGTDSELTRSATLQRAKGFSDDRASVAPRVSRSSTRAAEEDPDYSVYSDWAKAGEESRTLFRELKTFIDQLGRVRTDAFKTVISFKCMATSARHPPVLAYVYLRVASGIRVLIHERHVRDIPLEEGFTRLNDHGQYREIVIRNREQIRRAEPLLRKAYARTTA